MEVNPLVLPCLWSFRLSLGDWAESCVLGEVSWPLVYGIAIDQLGVDNVHRYVGVEEFSKYDSPFTLTKQGTVKHVSTYFCLQDFGYYSMEP